MSKLIHGPEFEVEDEAERRPAFTLDLADIMDKSNGESAPSWVWTFTTFPDGSVGGFYPVHPPLGWFPGRPLPYQPPPSREEHLEWVRKNPLAATASERLELGLPKPQTRVRTPFVMPEGLLELDPYLLRKYPEPTAATGHYDWRFDTEGET